MVVPSSRWGSDGIRMRSLRMVLRQAQHERGNKARLRAFEGQHLEQMALVVGRDAPLLVVVAEHQLAPGGPVASGGFGHASGVAGARRQRLSPTRDAAVVL